jgi:Xaa-Pro dipeptidase
VLAFSHKTNLSHINHKFFKNPKPKMFNPHSIPFQKAVKLPSSFFRDNRTRVVNALKASVGETLKRNSYIMVQSQEPAWDYDNDCENDYYAECNFFYLFGNELYADMYGLVNLDTLEATLSAQDTSTIERVITKLIHRDEMTPDEVNADKIIHTSELREFFALQKDIGTIYLLGRANATNDYFLKNAIKFDWLNAPSYDVDKLALLPVIEGCRVIKSEAELNFMRHITKIAAEGHKFTMKHTRPGMHEYQIGELFKFYISWNGCKRLAYQNICGAGLKAAILHYHENDEILEDGQLVMNDMGARSSMYRSDISTTWPVNGKFTEKQKEIYNIVLAANQMMIAQLKPDETYVSLDKPSRLFMAQELLKLGLIKKPPTLEGEELELALKRATGIFYPHAWGHYIGLYTHDVGAWKERGTEKLEFRGGSMGNGDPFQPGMCVTIEPGIYFIRPLIEKAKTVPELDCMMCYEKWEEYFHVGGVRIEDDMIITESGSETMSAGIPRTVEEIEEFMRSD